MEKRSKKKLLDQVREVIRLKHYLIRTEEAYVNGCDKHGVNHLNNNFGLFYMN